MQILETVGEGFEQRSKRYRVAQYDCNHGVTKMDTGVLLVGVDEPTTGSVFRGATPYAMYAQIVPQNAHSLQWLC